MPQCSFNQDDAKSEKVRDEYWRQGMTTAILAAYRAVAAFPEADVRESLEKITVPALILHGIDDQIVPLASGSLTAKIVKSAKLMVYEGAPHSSPAMHEGKVNANPLAFLKS